MEEGWRLGSAVNGRRVWRQGLGVMLETRLGRDAGD